MQKVPWVHKSLPEWHLDRFIRFCTAHLLSTHRDRAMCECVGKGRVCALRVGDARQESWQYWSLSFQLLAKPLRLAVSKEKYHGYSSSQSNLPHRYGNSHAGPDLSVWRPWAGSLLEAPTVSFC